jgi:hypothetical protein
MEILVKYFNLSTLGKWGKSLLHKPLAFNRWCNKQLEPWIPLALRDKSMVKLLPLALVCLLVLLLSVISVL